MTGADRSRGRVVVHVAMSLDGFIAAPNDDLDWVFEYTETSSAAEMVIQTTGSIHAEAAYGGAWSGPQFVLMHDPPEAPGQPGIAVLSDDIRGAVATALAAADGRNLILTGVTIVRECLRAGLVDELLIHVAPILLGDGVRLFAGFDGRPIELEPLAAGKSGRFADLRFRVSAAGRQAETDAAAASSAAG